MYVTAADLITRFSADELVQLADRSQLAVTAAMFETLVAAGDMSAFSQEVQDATQAVLDVVNEAIADAESEVNAYLQPRYDLPLSSVPPILKRMTADVARYLLHGDAAGEIVEMRYKDARKFLEIVSAGRASLGLDAADEETVPTGGPRVSSGTPDRVMTSDNLSGYLG